MIYDLLQTMYFAIFSKKSIDMYGAADIFLFLYLDSKLNLS